MSTLGGIVDVTTVGGLDYARGYPGLVKDSSEYVEITRMNQSLRAVVAGTADATASGLYGGSSSIDTLTLILNVNGAGSSPLTIAKASNAATQAAFLAAIKAKTEWAGIDARIGGPNGNQLILSATASIVVGAGTANTLLGLTSSASTNVQQVIGIDFGKAVANAFSGSNAWDNICAAPYLDTDKIIGISIRDTLVRPVGSDHKVDYSAGYMVRILNFGYIYAVAAEAVTFGDYVCSITQGNTTDANNGALGSIATGAAGVGRVSLDGTLGNIKAIWQTTCTAGQVGIVKVG